MTSGTDRVGVLSQQAGVPRLATRCRGVDARRLPLDGATLDVPIVRAVIICKQQAALA